MQWTCAALIGLAQGLRYVAVSSFETVSVIKADKPKPHGWSCVCTLPGIATAPPCSQAFGRCVSGELMLYDGQGTLRYQGGITGSRAHEEGSSARDILETESRTWGECYEAGFSCFVERTLDSGRLLEALEGCLGDLTTAPTR